MSSGGAFPPPGPFTRACGQGESVIRESKGRPTRFVGQGCSPTQKISTVVLDDSIEAGQPRH